MHKTNKTIYYSLTQILYLQMKSYSFMPRSIVLTSLEGVSILQFLYFSFHSFLQWLLVCGSSFSILVFLYYLLSFNENSLVMYSSHFRASLPVSYTHIETLWLNIYTVLLTGLMQLLYILKIIFLLHSSFLSLMHILIRRDVLFLDHCSLLYSINCI